MNYSQTTRNELNQNFKKTHRPGPLFGARNKEIFEIVAGGSEYYYSEEEQKVYDQLHKELRSFGRTPGTFFRTKYNRLVELCAGDRHRAEGLYSYFDKLNQFSFSEGWNRRTVRTTTYIGPIPKIIRILKTAYHMQIFGSHLAPYLKGELSEELLDYKDHYQFPKGGLDDLIAAGLDGGESGLREALIEIINSENNTAYLDVFMIRGIMKSSDRQLHQLLGQFLLAARLQEGMRQAICENMDCGTLEAFQTLFHVIRDHDLLRYSAVRRAVATWIGILDPEHLTRSSNKTFALMGQCVDDRSAAYSLLDSEDAMSLLVGLWGLGLYEIRDAIREMERMISSGTRQQKRVAAFFSQNLYDAQLQQKFANRLMEEESVDIEMAAGIFSGYMQGCRQEAMEAGGYAGYGQERKKPRPADLSPWFADRQTARRHYDILSRLLASMKKKKYQFNPYVFPWYFTEISRSDVLLRMCVIASGLKDQEKMDWLSGQLAELDGQNSDREAGVMLLLSRPDTPVRRARLIETLGDKATAVRGEAFRIAQDIQFTPEEYDQMCQLLRFKAADLRKNLIALLKEQDDRGLIRSLRILTEDKREDMRLAGLDIIASLARDQEDQTEQKDQKVKGRKTVLAEGRTLAAALQETGAATEREQILLKEILGEENTGEGKETEEAALYGEDDEILMPVLTCDKNDYPLFDITQDELQGLFEKLDKLIDDHKTDEFKTASGETVLLGNLEYLQALPTFGSGKLEDRVPLLTLWKSFYDAEIRTPERLTAMGLSLLPCVWSNGFSSPAEAAQLPYNQYLKKLMTEIFGEAVVGMDVTGLRYGRNGRYYRGLFHDILEALEEAYCDPAASRQLGLKVIRYLCCQVPENRRRGTISQMMGGFRRQRQDYERTPLHVPIVQAAIRSFTDGWDDADSFADRFRTLFAAETLFACGKDEYGRQDQLLEALDYVGAAYFGLITEGQMYRRIFEHGELRQNLQNLFMIYRAERYPYMKRQMKKFGLEDEKLAEYVRRIADRAADQIVRTECRRGDSPTAYSAAVNAIEHVYGTGHLVQLLKALGKEKLVRTGGFWYYSGSNNRNACLSHLISVCHPLPEETAETLRQALQGTSIGEKRLIEVAMYAPQWIDIIEEYLQYDGLKSGCWYFMAHMNDQYNQDEQKQAVIARFTPLEREELLGGAFDIAWFEDAYRTLGEKRFRQLYDAAKYISDGSKHARARKYADAALGRVEASELEPVISDKRNKDLLMSYPLVPLAGKADLLHRYEFIQQFRKESRQFGAQRRSSEGAACDMALRNLATRAGYRDVTRLTLAMEIELAESLQKYFQWEKLDGMSGGKSAEKPGGEAAEFFACIRLGEGGLPEVTVKKAERKGEKKSEKLLASVPAACKKHPYIAELKEANKKFREQYRRTVKMLELAMEERERFSLEELVNLQRNPVIRPVIENLVYICETGAETAAASSASSSSEAAAESSLNGLCGVIGGELRDLAGLAGGKRECSLTDAEGEVHSLPGETEVRVAHAFDLYRNKTWSGWQQVFFRRQQEAGRKQPFRQVFRELYVKLEEELDEGYSRMFAGYQIQPSKTAACLKGRRWIADQDTGLEKIYYKENIFANIYALADWFSPSDVEAPTLEWVQFSDRKTFRPLTIKEVPDIVYSEVMRDVDLAVSVAHAGGVDPETSHSTMEMRKVIAACNVELFGLKNVRLEGNHAIIDGSRGQYSVHLGSGVVHMIGVHQLNVLPVHSQHRGRIFLPFLDEDPKTAEIISKILLFADDKKIKDPYILDQMK